MKIRAKLTLRNEKMLSVREAKGLSQVGLSQLCGVSLHQIALFEAMQFASISGDRQLKAQMIADSLELNVSDVMPSDLADLVIQSTHHRTLEIESYTLASMQDRLALPSPSADLELDDVITQIRGGIERCDLTDREKLAVRMRYGIDHEREFTLGEVASEIGVTIVRVRQIINKAMRKMATDPSLRCIGDFDYMGRALDGKELDPMFA